jgi:hypothetical protein
MVKLSLICVCVWSRISWCRRSSKYYSWRAYVVSVRDLLGDAFIQVAANPYSLPPGFRKLILRRQSGQPILVATLLLTLEVVTVTTPLWILICNRLMYYWRLGIFESNNLIEYKCRAVEITDKIVIIRNNEWNV